MSKERPILFSAPMVRAILEGRKTQTRRVCNTELYQSEYEPSMVSYNGRYKKRVVTKKGIVFEKGQPYHATTSLEDFAKTCPHGQPGDLLWVRETFMPRAGDLPISRVMKPRYRADEGEDRQEWRGLWKPSIFMPRWASRITLRIKSVRVERLNQISAADALVEGIEHDQDLSRGNIVGWRDYLNRGGKCATAVGSFKSLWQSINGPDSWSADPWVWVIEFERVESGS